VIRAVLDANTIVSGLVRFRSGTSPPVLILHAWLRERFNLLISDWLLDEVTRTLSKPYFQALVEPEIHVATMEALQDEAIRVAVTTGVIGVATHPEDDLVLATAVSAAADYLVTGDKQLQQLANVEGVIIVSPREFLDRLEQDTD
jgi:putative PIN family toxin of toxin-antitoxin system